MSVTQRRFPSRGPCNKRRLNLGVDPIGEFVLLPRTSGRAPSHSRAMKRGGSRRTSPSCRNYCVGPEYGEVSSYHRRHASHCKMGRCALSFCHWQGRDVLDRGRGVISHWFSLVSAIAWEGVIAGQSRAKARLRLLRGRARSAFRGQAAHQR